MTIVKTEEKIKSGMLQKTVKVSAENHKGLNLFKIQNDLRTMDEAIGKLLNKENTKVIPDSADDINENFN